VNLSEVNQRLHGRIRDLDRADTIGIVYLVNRLNALAPLNLNPWMLRRRTDIQ
jgi:hypothetical protein